MPIPGSLSDGARVHVVRDAAIIYRDAIKLSDEHEAMRTLSRLAYEAQPVERDCELELWWAPDRAHALAVSLRVLRWQSHAVVLSVSCMPEDTPRICDAHAVGAVLDEYARAQGVSRADAERALRIAAWEARAVDDQVQPEQWRYRSRLTDEDVSLLVQRTGDGPPLIISASARVLASGASKRRPSRR